MSLCDECSSETDSLEPDEECDRCGKNPRRAHLKEELDLKGRPSQVLVVDAGQEDLEFVKDTLRLLQDNSGLEKDEMKQIAIFTGDLEFETVDLEE